MNGYTPSLETVTRIYNLIEQIPAEYRKDAESKCFSTGMSDHEYERNLTGYVMRKGWITDEQRKQAAEIAKDNNWLGMFETLPAMTDPRTDEQIALDIFQSETEATRESDRPL